MIARITVVPYDENEMVDASDNRTAVECHGLNVGPLGRTGWCAVWSPSEWALPQVVGTRNNCVARVTDDSGPVYARIDADRMFTFHMDSAAG
jgi:hypothetical protein